MILIANEAYFLLLLLVVVRLRLLLLLLLLLLKRNTSGAKRFRIFAPASYGGSTFLLL
jgi:hypothetical protein